MFDRSRLGHETVGRQELSFLSVCLVPQLASSVYFDLPIISVPGFLLVLVDSLCDMDGRPHASSKTHLLIK